MASQTRAQLEIGQDAVARLALADQVGRPQRCDGRGRHAEFIGSDRPGIQPLQVAERVVRLIRRAALDDGADRGSAFLRPNVGDRARGPSLHEFGIDDPLRFASLGKAGGMSIQEIARDCGERVDLPPLRLGPLAGFLDGRIDPLADQFEPAPRLLARAWSSVIAPSSPSARRVGFLGWSGKRAIRTKDRWPADVTRSASPGT